MSQSTKNEDPAFNCSSCGRTFTVRQEILDRYSGWKPSVCLDCRDRDKNKPAKPKRRKRGSKKQKSFSTEEVLERFTEGPDTGVFTDGACEGNPGPGGWGVVWVEGGEIKAELSGSAGQTTNNRMELEALIEAYKLLPEDAELTVWSDSNLCVKTVNEWAAGWARRGWKRKDGPVKNLELVKELYALALAHPKVKLRWIKAHDGSRWNEYADALATSYQRAQLSSVGRSDGRER